MKESKGEQCPICGKTGIKRLKSHMRFSHPTVDEVPAKEITMVESKKGGLESIRTKAALIGLDVDVVRDELVSAVIQGLPPPIDEVALIERVSATTEAKIAVKLAEVLEAVKASTDGNKPDTEGITKGVAALLQPQIAEAARQASEQVFAANSKAFFEQWEEKLKQQANPGSGAVSGQPQDNNMFNLISLADNLFDKYIKYKTVTQPPIGPGLEQLRAAMRLADIVNKLQRGEKSIEELGSAIEATQQPSKSGT